MADERPIPVQDIAWALTTLGARRAGYALYRNYYQGLHEQVFDIASETHGRYFVELLRNIRENLCRAVVRCFAERLSVDSWLGDSANAAGERARELRLDREMNRVHTDALKVGDSYVLVWPDSPERRLHRHRAENMATRTSGADPNDIELAAKLILEPTAKRIRVNLFYADRLERYAAVWEQGKGWPKPDKFFAYEADGSPALVRHSFGRVPVVRFSNDPEDRDESGTSILADVIPLQNALTKSVADVLIGSEFFALPMRVFTGVQAETDIDGESDADKFDPRRDRYLFFHSPNTQAVTLSQGDVTQLVEVSDAFALKIARVTGVPLHYLTLGEGSFPSGEALRTAEGRLVARTTDLHDEWGPQWSALWALLGLDGVTPRWTDPARLTETELLERARRRREVGVTWQQTMRELGYDDDTIQRMTRERQEERDLAAAQFGAAFDAGE